MDKPVYTFKHGKHLTVEEVADLYLYMKDDGLADFVFYDGGIKSEQDWMQFVHSNRCWVVRVDHPTEGIQGIWWLNGWQGQTAMIHFCVLGDKPGKRFDIGVQSMQWLHNKGILKSVYGLTPKLYRNVWPFQDALGFERIGKIPGACYMERRNKHIDGVVSVLDLSKYDKGA